MLNQRLADMKKTLQNELKSNGSEKVDTPNNNGSAVLSNTAKSDNAASRAPEKNTKKPSAIVMDDVNFEYLKHVILKFLTSREVTH